MNYFSKNKILGWLILIGLIINIVAISTILYKRNSFVRDNYEKDFQPHPSPIEFIKKELNLTEEQAAKFAIIKEESKKEAKVIFDSLRIKRSDLMAILAHDNPDIQSINTISNEIVVLQSKLLQHSIKQYLELKKILTKEQQLKFIEIYKDIFGCENMKHRRGGRGKHHGGGESCPNKNPEHEL
jgi:Spy/CpxP family protein refolding chaperone